MAFEGTVDQFPEATKSKEELLARAKEVVWYHTLPLSKDYTTPGIFALHDYVPYYLVPPSLKGVECLEVGAGNGYWSYELEKRGAKQVVATDIGDFGETDFSKMPGVDRPGMSGPGAFGEPLRIAATLYKSKLIYKLCSVYDLAPQRVGTHDLVFCGSMLMHLFGPHVALQRMSSICKNALLITTETEMSLDGASLVQFRGHEIPYVHFIPSPSALVNMIRCCGYEKVVRGPTFFLKFRDPAKPDLICHTSCIGLKDAAKPCFDLPRPQPVAQADRTADVELISHPVRVSPGQVFEAYVRVKNTGRTAWRGEENTPTALKLGFEVQTRSGGKVVPVGKVVESALPFLDYLPAGLTTLAKFTAQAPTVPGKFRFKPVVVQNGAVFRTNDVAVELEVDPNGAPPVTAPTSLRSVLSRVSPQGLKKFARKLLPK